MAGVQLQNGELRDEVIQPLVDSLDVNTADFATGLSNVMHAFFKAGGQGNPISFYNVPGGGPTLPYQNSFLLQGLGFLAQNYYTANSNIFLPILLDKSSIQLVVGTKPYLQVPVREVAGGVWQNSAAATTVAATTLHDFIQSFGPPMPKAMMFDRNHVVPIAPQQNFEIDWAVETLDAAEITATTPAANTNIRLQAVLYGALRRPAQ